MLTNLDLLYAILMDPHGHVMMHTTYSVSIHCHKQNTIIAPAQWQHNSAPMSVNSLIVQMQQIAADDSSSQGSRSEGSLQTGNAVGRLQPIPRPGRAARVNDDGGLELLRARARTYQRVTYSKL